MWRRLQAAGGVSTPFLAWEWFSALAEQPELSRSVRVVAVRRPGEPEAGLFPLELVRGPRGRRTVRCAGTDKLGADHLDVVALPADRGAVAAAVARYLARSLRWDAADLEGLAADGALARALRDELRLPRCLPHRSEVESVPVVALRGEEADAVRARLRRRCARGLKSAQRAGGGFSVVDDPDQVGALVESLMDMHNARFQCESVVFSTPALRTFHVTAVTRLAAAGMARVCRLSTATDDIALEYVLMMGDRAYSYQSGFRPDGGHSPGRTVMCQAMLVAAEEGRAEYDLLRGDESYKAEYATGNRPDVRIRALQPTVRAVAWGTILLLRRVARVARRRWGAGDGGH
ncbi:Acetyltransferase involved in cellulose biosynthesis, CelD/BcsL family [Geodermatophilus sabuli]|uniref:Acetyltransferase involved in cellulose biosynthesis, CelD/BcsL family n=2 Tax=Geodermatophilus sabuli TaxID=1564158 RepID=A0A285EDI4_9ACTN|nr:Acetyltransferase involved in cellulose biosynthesis, CelD/BcsL family [Geodermatophilus sabuli]